MLKNKEERRKFLEDPNNWNLLHELNNIGMLIYRLDFTDGTSLIRIDKKFKSTYPGSNKVEYKFDRIEILEDYKLAWNFYSMSFAIDYIMRKDLKK